MSKADIAINLKKGGKYNWKNQPERLVFLGLNFSGNGYWYQFALVESPKEVWCECQASDLLGIEETEPNVDPVAGDQMDYEDKVTGCIAELLYLRQCDVKMDSHKYDDLGMDSLDEIETVMMVEEEFSIVISDDEAESINTVSDMIELIKLKHGK